MEPGVLCINWNLEEVSTRRRDPYEEEDGRLKEKPLFCRLRWAKKSKQAPLPGERGEKVRSGHRCIHRVYLHPEPHPRRFTSRLPLGQAGGGGAAEPRGTEPRILLGLVQWFLTMTAADSLAGLPSEMPLASERNVQTLALCRASWSMIAAEASHRDSVFLPQQST